VSAWKSEDAASEWAGGMNSFRVVKNTRAKDTWYVIEIRRKFLWWSWWSVVDLGFYHRNRYDNPQEAKDLIDYWNAEIQSEVVS